MVNQLATPVMAELQSDHERLRAAFLRAVRLVACAAFPLCIGLMLVARPLVEVLLTSTWSSAAPVMQVLCLFALVRSIAILLPPVLMARYRARFLFAYTTVQMVCMTLAFWIGAAWGGAIGVALALVTGYPVVLSWLARETFRSISVPFQVVWAQIWPPSAATALMAASVLGVGWCISAWPADLALARLVLMAATGAVTYSTALLVCGGAVRGELVETLGFLLRRGQAPTAAK
jgi:O-antigen/teichoic acid export membrane protein